MFQFESSRGQYCGSSSSRPTEGDRTGSAWRMNSALKLWKEAATVVLAAGLGGSRVPAPVQGRPAFDYAVLLLRRSGRSGFMPGACVFPGGLAETSDFSSAWLDLFGPVAQLPNFGLGVVKQPPETRPPMFSTDRARLGSPVPGDVAFRICAVRETFEEAGVLLVLPSHEAPRPGTGATSARSLPSASNHRWDTQVIAQWRSLVIQNSSNFIRMCRELECLPNIWALHEWGNWLTPTGVSARQRRYDTAFYMCCLQEVPHTLQDQKEIVEVKWSTPPEILSGFQNREFWIAPPQFYDLGRMCNFPVLSDLHDFARQRSLEGSEQWLPVHLPAADGLMSLLPGDSLYPENPDSGTTNVSVSAEKSVEELQKESPNLHRIVSRDQYTASVHINITPKYNHLPPLTSSALNGSSKQDCKL